MNYENIHMKNIPKLEFIGEVAPKGIENLEQSLQDLFLLSEDQQLANFE